MTQIYSIISLVGALAIFAGVTKYAIKNFMIVSFNTHIKKIIEERSKLPFEPLVDEEEYEDEEGMTPEEKKANKMTILTVGIPDIFKGFGYVYPEPQKAGDPNYLMELLTGKTSTGGIALTAIIANSIVAGAGALIAHFLFSVAWPVIGAAVAWLVFLGALYL